jgi:hypothetical protein
MLQDRAANDPQLGPTYRERHCGSSDRHLAYMPRCRLVADDRVWIGLGSLDDWRWLLKSQGVFERRYLLETWIELAGFIQSLRDLVLIAFSKRRLCAGDQPLDAPAAHPHFKAFPLFAADVLSGARYRLTHLVHAHTCCKRWTGSRHAWIQIDRVTRVRLSCDSSNLVSL